MSCKGKKCNRAYLKLSIAEEKKTQQTKINYFKIYRTDLTSNIQSYSLCKDKLGLLLLGQGPYEDYRFSATHVDADLKVTVLLLLSFPDLQELVQITHLLVVQRDTKTTSFIF